MQTENHHAHEPETPLPVEVVQPPTGNPGIDQQVRELVKKWGYDHSPEQIEEMLGTVLKMAQDRMSLADLKMYNRSLKELRESARLFAKYTQFRKVSVFGSARTSPQAPEFVAAVEFAHRMTQEGLHDHHRRR